MSEEILGKDNKPKTQHELHIIWNDKGIQVSGCILAEVLALGLLEKAKDIVRAANRPKLVKSGNTSGAFGKKRF